jgi:hypothetical protein
MVEIGRVRVNAGNAPIEQKISAYPPQADICAFVSTSLETKRAAKRPSRAPDGQNANGSGWRTANGMVRPCSSPAPPAAKLARGLTTSPSDVVELAQRRIDRENRIQDQGGLS